MSATTINASVALWLGLSYMSGVVGCTLMTFSPSWKEWYAHLKKAPWSPPNYAFAPVWFVLYSLRGLASWLAFRAIDKAPSPVVWNLCWAFGIVTLALNASWVPVFFGLRAIRLALLVLLLTLASAIMHAGLCWSIDQLTGALLVPEILWLLLAFSLNLYVVVCNEVAKEDDKSKHQ